jgi:inhibitor of cysteine peptidase
MSRKLFVFFVIPLVLFSMTACSSRQTRLTAADNGKAVIVNAGEQIVITLDGNPSTGYSWEAKDLDASMFQQVGEAKFKNSNPALVGSGGTLTLTFKALKSGTATLSLVYHRSWETNVAPANNFTVNVTVK